MQFVLADMKFTPTEGCEITGKVNCESLSIDGLRFAPRTALVMGFSWQRGRHPVVEIERIESNIRTWLEPHDFGGHVIASIEQYPRSMDVDRLLIRCEQRRPSRFARLLRWLRRIGR